MSWLSSIGNAIGGLAKKALPMVSFATSFIPGVGPLLSKGLDIVGNVIPDSQAGDASAQPQAPAPQFNFGTLGQSAATQALAASNSFLGIGGSAPGIFGIGDGKPGVFGIGTGVNEARNKAEKAALASGATPAAAKYAGESAAAEAAAAPPAAATSNIGLMVAAAAAFLLLL